MSKIMLSEKPILYTYIYRQFWHAFQHLFSIILDSQKLLYAVTFFTGHLTYASYAIAIIELII